MVRSGWGVLAVWVVLVFPSWVRAESDAYCEKVRSRAAADAALLLAPTVHGRVIQFPSSGFVDPTLTTSGNDLQARAELSLSALDMYRATQVLKAADLDCTRHDSAERLMEFVELGADYGRAAALRAALSVLESSASELETQLATAQQRFDARTITLAQFLETRRAHSRLQSRLLELRGDLERLKASGAAPVERVDALKAVVERSSARLEDQLAHVRSLDAWDLRVTGGAVATRPADFFGAIELRYNLGGLFRESSEDRYLAARARELRTARGELVRTAEVVQTRLKATEQEVKGRLELIRRNLSDVREMRQMAQRSDTAAALQSAGLLFFEEVTLESEAAYLEAWARELGKL